MVRGKEVVVNEAVFIPKSRNATRYSDSFSNCLTGAAGTDLQLRKLQDVGSGAGCGGK